MLIAPWSWNLLASGTLVSSAGSFQAGYGGDQAWSADLGRPAIPRGRVVVTTGSNDKIDWNDGSVRAATLTAGTYSSVTEALVMVAARMTAVSGTWSACLLHGSTNRYRVRLSVASGTPTVLNATGANAATNALVKLFGFGPYDRSAAASHTGDFACAHGPAGDIIEADLGAAGKMAEIDVVIGCGLSPGGIVSVLTGSTTPVEAASDLATAYAGGHMDPRLMLIRRSTVAAHRYAALVMTDPRREDWTRSSVRAWYHGPAIDTDRETTWGRLNFEAGSMRRTLRFRGERANSVAGHIHFGELPPGQEFEVAFTTSPGLGPELEPSLRSALEEIGSGQRCIVAMDPATEPHRETALCRFQAPVLTHVPTHSRWGRWSVALKGTVETGVL